MDTLIGTEQSQQGMEGQSVTNPEISSVNSLPDELAQFVQADTTVQPQNTIDYEKQYKEIQKLVSKKDLEAQELRQNLAMYQQQMAMLAQQQQMAQVPDAPPDPYQDFNGYIRWNNEQVEKRALDKARGFFQTEMQNLVSTATEINFKNAHPDIDIDQLKQFNRNNGIMESALETGYKLMTMNDQIRATAKTSAENTFNQFKQTTAQPIRGGVPPQQPMTIDTDKLVSEIARDPSLLHKLPPEIVKGLQKEIGNLMQYV